MEEVHFFGQQVGGVEHHAIGYHFRAFSFGRMCPQSFDAWVFIAFAQHHAQHGQFTVGAFVHKVNHHGRGFAVNLFFAGAMEVKLQQVIRLAVDSNFGTRGHIHLNGVAVVHNFELALFVVGGHAKANLFKRTFDVQRCLRLASAAGWKFFTPVFWAHGAFIVPMGNLFVARTMGVTLGIFVAVFTAFFFILAVFAFAVFGIGFFSGLAFAIAFGLRLFTRTLRHDLHFLASCRQGVLRSTNDFLLAFPVGHLERFLESLDGGRIFGAVG